MNRIILTAVTVFTFSTIAIGADTDRERRTKVALALTAKKEVITDVAPTPNEKKWPDFVDGYKTAVNTNSVLVCYIGCEGSHPIEAIEGAVVATQKELSPYSKGTILIAYPVNKELLEHKQLRCEQYEKVVVEVKAAAKKNVVGADKAIGKPLDWTLISTDVAPKCTSCSDCKCPADYCPNRCTVLKVESGCKNCKECSCTGKCNDSTCNKTVETPAVPKVESAPVKKEEPKVDSGVVTQPPQIAGYTLWKNPDGTYFYTQGNSGCKNGKCPNQR